MFIFPLLYGIVSAEMFVISKSVWMSTGFHWLWNYSITSVYKKNGKYFIEQPYNGIYRISPDEYNSIGKYISN